MDICKPQLVKVEAFAYFFNGEFCNTLCIPHLSQTPCCEPVSDRVLAWGCKQIRLSEPGTL